MQNTRIPVVQLPRVEPTVFHPTDLGNSERLIARHRGDLMYCYGVAQVVGMGWEAMEGR